MSRHRRIPKKNRNKLKSVDPFNRKARSLLSHNTRKLNRAPKADEIDNQEMPRSMQEMMRLQQVASDTSAEKRAKYKRQAKLDDASEQAGFKRRKFETEGKFMKRINRETHEHVQEELLKVRFGLAGRDPKEIEDDLKQLGDKDKSKKAKNPKSKNPFATGSESAQVSADQNIDGVAKSAKQTATTDKNKSTKIDRKTRKRMLKAETASRDHDEELLNAREFIPFGERVDGPPEFSKSAGSKELKAGFAKAGSKQLLLTSLLTSKTDESIDASKLEEETGDLAAERERVIAAYRTLKREKRIVDLNK